jgi:HKD family nuclease
MRQLRGILGATDRAVVASAPDDLKLGQELSAARRVLLATAFARSSGWKLLKRDLLSGSAELSLLTGLDFLQTGPDLLREWLGLTKRYTRIKAKTASRDSIFHPKVLIVKASSPSRNFAIVGSGNLTGGGLRTNTECSLYTNDHAAVRALEGWFDKAWKKGTCLTATAIRKYEPKYKKARKAAQQIRNEQKEIQRDIEEIARRKAAKKEAILRFLKEAVIEFNSYRKKAEFESQYRSRKRAVAVFRRLLHVPSFDFSNKEFAEFYNAPQLGGLRERWLREILRRPARLKSGLRYLIDEGAPIEERVNSFLEKRGRHRIPGFNIAGVSKVLAVAHSNRWPVLNGPVRKTLSHFQYESPRGSVGERYRQFAELARRFNAPDFLALDAFFKHKEGELKRSGD